MHSDSVLTSYGDLNALQTSNTGSFFFLCYIPHLHVNLQDCRQESELRGINEGILTCV